MSPPNTTAKQREPFRVEIIALDSFDDLAGH
jgi:hypothetical protein